MTKKGKILKKMIRVAIIFTKEDNFMKYYPIQCHFHFRKNTDSLQMGMERNDKTLLETPGEYGRSKRNKARAH